MSHLAYQPQGVTPGTKNKDTAVESISKSNCRKRVDNDSVERMLYSCYLFSRRFATCLLVQHLLKSFPTQLWTDVAIQKIYVYIHTHSKMHIFHVNLYHGIKHDCGKTCVYNSVYIIYIYNFKYTIYLIFFHTKQVCKNTSMVKNNYFFFMRGRWRKCKKHEQQKKSILRNEFFQVKKTSFNEASYCVNVCL